MNFAVIGANWGDEGKGLVTDYLAHADALVVRHSGGAQAGHTVVRPDGLVHEFHHIGAGTFRGAPTLLSRFFIVNPILFLNEWKRLTRYVQPKVFVDYRAYVTTPFDMLSNQYIEMLNRHGSCGVGINETVTRAVDGFPLTVEMLTDPPSVLEQRLRDIHDVWLQIRRNKFMLRRALNVDPEQCISQFMIDARQFLEHVEVTHDREILSSPVYQDVIFEGSQGLRLDEFSSDFPHVTRARTGLTNVAALLQELGNPRLTAYYVTRVYATRHGAGPLPLEVPEHPFGWRGEEINETNEWQGHFRYARIDPYAVIRNIECDLADTNYRNVDPQIVVTCLDQMGFDDPVPIVWDLFRNTSVPVTMMSHGRTRNDLRPLRAPQEEPVTPLDATG